MGYVLGINAPPTLLSPEQCPYGGHDPSACLVDEDGRVTVFEEQERHSKRRYGVFEYPADAVRACLDHAGADVADIDVVAVGWDVPRVGAVCGEPWRYSSARHYLRLLGLDAGTRPPELVFVQHHRAHAASSFHASPYESAAVLVMDGNGEDDSISVYRADRTRGLLGKARLPQPASLGDMYAAVCEHLRLGVLNAGKTMGLASYGRAAGMTPFPLLTADGMPLFDHHEDDQYATIMRGWSRYLGTLTGRRRAPRATMHEDEDCVRLAWSAQSAVEEHLTRLAAFAREVTGESVVCLSGGVALNCSANGRLDGEVFCPPVPHDGGVALGAAWAVRPPRQISVLDPFLGRALDGDLPPDLTGTDLDLDEVVRLLGSGAVGGIAEGRAEIGPRALGHRSIIALPSIPGVRDRINVAKGREMWRPLAPVALASQAGRFWEVKDPLQRFMLAATTVTPHGRLTIPEAVHVDGTARAQIVQEDDHTMARVIAALDRAGYPPVLINTSLNGRGRPIAHDIGDVAEVYRECELDFLIVDGRLVVRK
ncbi:carbamoyltransferase [Sphaerisporangium album]|uniref:Carbamoyltransferase n=1 Tax=Sphaerisporangium album TaxID=509200 RepID=A0A367FM17_9ACTN|nr:carbamoyltransferase C-terminal domain-containing protein [Sphaerisporangium album]RCG30665.1 carbamoyltransferase [Sphaerisporangium album]